MMPGGEFPSVNVMTVCANPRQSRAHSHEFATIMMLILRSGKCQLSRNLSRRRALPTFVWIIRGAQHIIRRVEDQHIRPEAIDHVFGRKLSITYSAGSYRSRIRGS
jgi:hypothetical protein